MWTYNQANGILSRNGVQVGTGYSGSGVAKNCPDLQDEPNAGPIPVGKWTIGPRFDSQSHGPVCMRLDPVEGTETYGRGGFLIHGDSILKPGTGSKGCIILPRPVRLQIAASGDSELEVV